MVVELVELVENREAAENQRMGRVTWVDSWRMKDQLPRSKDPSFPRSLRGNLILLRKARKHKEWSGGG